MMGNVQGPNAQGHTGTAGVCCVVRAGALGGKCKVKYKPKRMPQMGRWSKAVSPVRTARGAEEPQGGIQGGPQYRQARGSINCNPGNNRGQI